MLRWRRQLIRCIWIFATHPNTGKRPALDQGREALIVRLAQENNSCGCGNMVGELLKSGFDTYQTNIRNILDQHARFPGPTLTDAILDLLVHNPYRLQLKDESQRKIRSPLPMLTS